jgi:hypothetical protein
MCLSKCCRVNLLHARWFLKHKKKIFAIILLVDIILSLLNHYLSEFKWIGNDYFIIPVIMITCYFGIISFPSALKYMYTKSLTREDLEDTRYIDSDLKVFYQRIYDITMQITAIIQWLGFYVYYKYAYKTYDLTVMQHLGIIYSLYGLYNRVFMKISLSIIPVIYACKLKSPKLTSVPAVIKLRSMSFSLSAFTENEQHDCANNIDEADYTNSESPDLDYDLEDPSYVHPV